MLPSSYQKEMENAMRTKRRNWGAFGFLLPATIIYLSVIVIPVFYSFYISLFRWNGISKMQWVGLSNYITLFTKDPIFHISIRNNLIWIALTLFLTMSVALLLAVLLNKHSSISLQLLLLSQYQLSGDGCMNQILGS